MAYSNMYGNVLNRAKQSGTWATDRVKDYLNKAQGVIWRKAKEWTVLENQDTADGVVGQANYALPDDFERPISLQLELDANYYNVTEKSYDSVRQSLNVNTGNGRPYIYCIHYDQILFGQKLDAIYTMRLDYIGQPADMSADENDTVLPEHILEEYAYAFLMRDLGHDQKFMIAYQNFEKMLEEYAESDGRGEALHGFYDGLDGVQGYWSARRMWS
jgi:hypothetical protein